MKKNDFIYTGSALYRISKIENNLVKVVPTSRKMTCSLASRTYHQSQLEDLGYKIRGVCYDEEAYYQKTPGEAGCENSYS